MSRAKPPESTFGYTTENPVIEVVRHETKIDPKELSKVIHAMDNEFRRDKRFDPEVKKGDHRQKIKEEKEAKSWEEGLKQERLTPGPEKEKGAH